MAVGTGEIIEGEVAAAKPTPSLIREAMQRNKAFLAGVILISILVIMAVASPLIATHDPMDINPSQRLRPPATDHWFGTDHLGRDLFSRVVYGCRVSLVVGLAVASVSTLVGLMIGLVAGYVRMLDAATMRIMDGFMAVPGVLLAIALMAITEASIQNVIIAISITEIPRMTRLVRAVVLSLREQPFVEAAAAIGTTLPNILWRHILPNVLSPVLVQATYVCASAMLTEAVLGFLGAGTPPEVPSWGNIVAEGRTYVMIAFWIVAFPGMFLAGTVLAVNLMGDGLRDSLDPYMRRQL